MNPLHQNQGFVSATPQTDLEEGDLTFPVLDQDIDLVTHLEEELDLRIPSFLCDENPTEQTLPGEEENELIFPHLSFLEVEKAFPQVEESLTLPIFDEGIDLVPHTEEELNLHVPSFLYSENLTQLPSTENNLAIPQFSQTKIPYEVSFADEEEATIPELFPIKFPIPTRSLEFRLKIPIFTETKSPRRLTIDFPSLHFPEFVPIQAPGFILPVNSSLLQIPRFFKTRFPRPIFSPLPTPLKEPTFLRIQDPQFRMHEKTFLQRGTLLSQKKERKENEWGIFLQYHPILKNFQKLSSKLSYVDILSQAVQIDSLGDVRAIKKHFIKIQYLNSLFADLLSIAPSVLERSEDANILLENDQPQIDLLTTFCKELVRIDSIESLPFRKHPLIERLIDFKNLMTKGCPPLAFSQLCDKNLLMFKENIFCFLQEILRQELVASKKFGAVQKNMIPLAKRLPHLATHILREKNRLRMQQIRSFASVNFALWEDRTPIDPVPSEPEFTRTPQIPTPQQLNEGLAAIQAERPPVFKLTDFTNQVLSLPERTKREALLKGKYLLEFGKVYCGRFFNPTALKRGIAWIDQAIEVLQKKYKKRNPHLLECYHYRGVAWKKWAEYLKEKESDRDLVRKRVDTCSRDFHASCYLPQEDKTNFVTYLKDSRKIKNNSLALQSIEKAIAGDRDYSEAHYLKFLREFEVLQLDQTRMLHPHFEILKTSTPETIIQKFKAILVKPAHRIYSLFKVTCSARSAYIQFDADKILMSELGLDFLLEMLTQGVKKVRLNPQTKAYFGQTVSQEKLYETVQTLGDSKKRLKEIERGLHTFHTFELAAFYKATVLNEETTLDCRWARQKLAPGLLRNSISLDACAMDAHFREGKKLNSPQHFVCALIFACRAIEACNQFLSHSEEETIYTKRLELIVERALI
ncbi:MAG: hypothetical protein ACXWM2_04820, partial [Parachlamydiaceae bacterium]